MNGTKLCDALSIDRRQLKKWTADGLPCTRDRRGRPDYDPAAVRIWLIDKGLAQDTTTATTRDQVAAHFGVSLRTVAGWLAAGAPGQPGAYPLAAIQAWRDKQNADRKPGDVDPLLAGTSSPALERYRDERAKLARLDRMAREGQLIDRDAVHAALAEIAAIIRQAGETLQRDFGQAARDVLDEALDEAAAHIEQYAAVETAPE